jgi:ABC-type nickel/cobalt efflux system permease component RcnA
MKNKISCLIIAISCFFVAQPVLAHPLDISVSELNILPDSHQIKVSTYLHPYEGDYLLTNKNKFTLDKITDFYLHEETFFEYLKQNLTFKNNGGNCVFQEGDMPPKDEIEIVADGIQIDYTWLCKGSLDKLSFSNTLFIDDFSLQTNKMMFYLKGKYDKVIYEKVLTTKVYTDGFNLNSPPNEDATKLIDTDGDGLSDYEEGLYLTDPAIKDTDFDGYTDKEEVDNGWDARDPVPSPGQTMRVATDEARRKQTAYWNSKPMQQKTNTQPTADVSALTDAPLRVDIATATPSSDALTAIGASSSSDDGMSTTTENVAATSVNPVKPSGAFFFQNERLKKILQMIKSLLNSPGLASKLLVFFPVFLLGFLHSLESGHGKSVLISYLVETERTLWDALKFSLTLALTDIAGVIVLGAGFEILFLSGSGYLYMNSIQTIGAWILLGLGISLLGRALFRYFQPWRKLHEEEHHHTVALGFLAGLVPCTSGWALILTVISLDQVKWMLPIVLIFGLGIFLFLVVLSALILKFRNVLAKKIPWIAKISPILSGTLIILVACTALVGTYWR